MARSYARIVTAVWRDADFRALDDCEQRTYFMLISQPDISAAGILHLSHTRWSAQARNTTPESVLTSLAKLAKARYVIYDLRTEELLVRSFVRWDGGYNNIKRKPSIRDAALQVESPIVRRMLAIELSRLGLPDWLPDALSDSTSNTTPNGRSGDKPISHSDEDPLAIGDDLFSQGNSLSDRASDTTSQNERVVVTKGPYLLPQPTTHNPQPSAPSVLPAQNGALTINQRSRLITNVYTDIVKLSNWPAVNGIVKKAVEAQQWTDDAIREAMLRMAQVGRGVTTETLRIELDGLPPARSRDSPASAAPERIPPDQRCPEHRDQRANNCRHCKARAKAGEAA